MIQHSDIIQTGNDIADGVITVLLSTTILIGGVVGCLLDNIIPGETFFQMDNAFNDRLKTFRR